MPKKSQMKNPPIHYLRKISNKLNKYFQLHGVLMLPVIQEFLITTLEIPEALDFTMTSKILNDNFTKVVKEFSQDQNLTESSSSKIEENESDSIAVGVVLYEFVPETQFELALKKDEKVEILNKINEDWYFVKSQIGATGYCPVSYLYLEY